MKQPIRSDGTENAPGEIAVIDKAMQGAGDVNRIWVEHRDRYIMSWGWTRLTAEPSAFDISSNSNSIRLVADTDDFLVATNSHLYLEQVRHKFIQEWQITSQNPVKQHANLRIDKTPTTLTVLNPKGINEVLRQHGMTDLILPRHPTPTAMIFPPFDPTKPPCPTSNHIRVSWAACDTSQTPPIQPSHLSLAFWAVISTNPRPALWPQHIGSCVTSGGCVTTALPTRPLMNLSNPSIFKLIRILIGRNARTRATLQQALYSPLLEHPSTGSARNNPLFHFQVRKLNTSLRPTLPVISPGSYN
jgi:hypothetical protein